MIVTIIAICYNLTYFLDSISEPGENIVLISIPILIFIFGILFAFTNAMLDGIKHNLANRYFDSLGCTWSEIVKIKSDIKDFKLINKSTIYTANDIFLLVDAKYKHGYIKNKNIKKIMTIAFLFDYIINDDNHPRLSNDDMEIFNNPMYRDIQFMWLNSGRSTYLY